MYSFGGVSGLTGRKHTASPTLPFVRHLCQCILSFAPRPLLHCVWCRRTIQESRGETAHGLGPEYLYNPPFPPSYSRSQVFIQQPHLQPIHILSRPGVLYNSFQTLAVPYNQSHSLLNFRRTTTVPHTHPHSQRHLFKSPQSFSSPCLLSPTQS